MDENRKRSHADYPRLHSPPARHGGIKPDRGKKPPHLLKKKAFQSVILEIHDSNIKDASWRLGECMRQGAMGSKT
jgi:hypothetical protein